MALLSRFLRPEASRRMLVDEGEFIVDEVTRHWVTRVVPVLIVIAGMACFAVMPLLGAAWWVGLLLAVCIVLAGTCGDLIESLIKRDVGIKDMSSFLPGHGGVMDRIDAMLVAAAPAWLVMYLLVPGG